LRRFLDLRDLVSCFRLHGQVQSWKLSPHYYLYFFSLFLPLLRSLACRNDEIQVGDHHQPSRAKRCPMVAELLRRFCRSKE
jgi:hypothetical protein